MNRYQIFCESMNKLASQSKTHNDICNTVMHLFHACFEGNCDNVDLTKRLPKTCQDRLQEGYLSLTEIPTAKQKEYFNIDDKIDIFDNNFLAHLKKEDMRTKLANQKYKR